MLVAVCTFVGLTIYGLIQRSDQTDYTESPEQTLKWVRFGLFVVLLIVFLFSQYRYRQGWTLISKISREFPTRVNVLHIVGIILVVIGTVVFSLAHFRILKWSIDINDMMEIVCVLMISLISLLMLQTVASARMAYKTLTDELAVCNQKLQHSWEMNDALEKMTETLHYKVKACNDDLEKFKKSNPFPNLDLVEIGQNK
jgi:hypothetical protein